MSIISCLFMSSPFFFAAGSLHMETFLLKNQHYYHSDDSLQIDSRLYGFYDVTYLNNIQKDNPALLMLLNFTLDNSYMVIDLIKDKDYIINGKLSKVKKNPRSKSSSKNALKDFKSNNLNILDYNFIIDKNKRSIFRIDGTNKGLLFFTRKDILNKFKESIKIKSK